MSSSPPAGRSPPRPGLPAASVDLAGTESAASPSSSSSIDLHKDGATGSAGGRTRKVAQRDGTEVQPVAPSLHDSAAAAAATGQSDSRTTASSSPALRPCAATRGPMTIHPAITASEPSNEPLKLSSDPSPPQPRRAIETADFEAAETRASPSPTTPSRAHAHVPNYATPGGSPVDMQPRQPQKHREVRTTAGHTSFGSGGAHTPGADLFDPVNGLPTVPSITSPSPMPPIPIDRTTSPPKDAQPHQSVDLTAPHATPMLDAARIQDIPVEPVEPDAPVAQSIPPTSLHDGMLDRAWWWSVLSMGFLGPILSLGNKRALQIGDIPMFSVKDEPAAVVAVVQAEWEKRIAKDPSTGSAVPKVSHPLARTLFACYGWRILAGALSTMFGRWVLIVTPLFTKEFLTWIRADSSASGKSAGFLFEFARGTLGYGIGIVVLLFFILILASVYSNHSYYQGVRMGCSFRGALMSLIFEKSLRCPAFARAPDKVEKGEKPLQGGGGGGGGTGQTVNIMANDTQQIFDAATMMHFTWVEPLFIIFTIILMYTEIGFAALPAGGLMLLLFPVQILVARRIGRNRGQMVRHTDARVKILSEILQGIRVIKFYAWEVPMAERVQEIRVLELACVKYALLLKSFNLLTLFFWPVFVSMVTFIVYVALGEHLTVVKSIEILAFVNVLAKPITVLPLALIACAEVRVSIRRIEKYLLGDELERSPQLLMESDEASQQSDPQPSPDVLMSPQETTGLLDRQASPQTPFPSSQQPQLGLELAALATKADRPASSLRPSPIFVESRRTLPSSSLAITVSSASFAWDRSASSSAAPALRDITFEVPKGGLIGVIGSVGAGKTTLFSALLGELVKVRGSVSIRGRLAYMSQSAWIQNCTLKDNILFGLPFDPVRYQAAIEAAALATDLLLLPAGDATEIGERGITLSGGQKSRVSLARAVYRSLQSDIFLLDDPFAAVDVSTGSTMFHQSIGPTSILHDKTRMVVLNSHLHLLKFFDQVWVMESSPAGGQIVAKGRYEEIEAKFPALLQQDRLATQVEGEGEQNAPTSGRALNEIKEEASDEVSIVTTRNGGPSRAKTALYLPRMIDDGTASIVVPQPNRRGSTSFYLPTSPDGSMDVGAVWEHRQVPQSGDDVLKSQLKAHRKHQEREESVSVYHMASRQNALSPSHGALSPIPIFSTYHDVGDGDEATALVGSADTAPVGHLQQASRSFYHLTRESALKKDSPSPQLDQHAAYRPSALQWPAHGPLTKKDSEAREGSPLHSAQSQTDSPLRVVRAMQLAHLGGGASGTPRQDTPADSPRAGVDAKLRRTSFSVAAPPPETLEPESNPTTVAVLAPTSVAASPAPSLMAREDRASGSVGFQMWRYYFDLIALAKVPEMMDVDEETIPKVPGKGAKAVIASFTNQGGMLQASFTNQGNNNLQAPQKGGVVVSATPTPTETSTPEEVDSSDLPVAVIQDPETTRVVSTTYAGVAILVAVVAYFILCQVVRVGCDLLLTFWGSEQASATTARAEGRDPNEHSLLFWALLCLAATFIAIILVGLRAWIFVRLALRTSHALHRILFRRLLLAPITTFYDVQPLGRILNRMSKDMDQCDSFLPDLMAQFFQHGFNLVGGLVLSVVSTPYFLAVLAPICFAFYHLQAYFRVCSRELKRIEGITRSPIFSTFGETLLGLPTIRAYRCEEAFILKQRAAIRANNKIYQAFYLSSRWLSLRLDLISNFLVLGVGLFGIFLRGGLDPALIGLAMLYTLQFLGLLQWAVRVSVDTENSMTSVERLSHYHNLPSEAAYIVPSSQSAPFGWPTRGAIVFSNLKLRYRPELPLVLKGVSAKIEPREKIGICGRTGSGKSSLMVSLFRIVESAPGSILIDGVDISLIGLRELRSSISIIPQDPVMFSGTIRSNLDPFHERTDAQLWQILEQVSMKAYVSSLQMGLESHVNEYGDNFSHGQKQLFCIARALLRQSRIIVLDEATAAVDNETDALIQKTIKESFADCTVLTIAHRLNTIMESDRIMVLDKGFLAEFDTPANLISRPESLFRRMVETADGVQADQE